jgi:cytoskeletal protein RodZ
MKDIGQEIQQARLAKGVTLEEIAGHTHIQLAHLQKIENGQFDFLPRPYVVAFIKTFAQHVGLHGETLVKRWREREQAEISQLEEQQHQQLAPQNEERKMGSAPLQPREPAVAQPIPIPYLKEIAIGLGMVVVMAGLIYVMSRPGDAEQAQNGRDNQPSSAQSSTPSRVQEIPFSQVSKEVAAKTQAQEQPAATMPELALQAQFERQTRVRLIRDGADTSIAVYRAGEVQNWRAQEKFNLRLSVAGVITLTLDGKNLGKFGQPGQIEYITITREGVTNKFAVTPKPRTTAPRDSIVVRPLDDLGPRRRN